MIKQYLIFLLITISFAKNEHSFVGEQLEYDANFSFFSIGEAILTFSSDSLNGKSYYKLTTTVKTNSFMEKIYALRYEIQSWLHRDNFSLKKYIENKIETRQNPIIHETNIYADSIAVSNGKSKKIPNMVYDPIAFIYYLRNQDLNQGTNYDFFSFGRKKIRKVIVNVTGIEKITVPAGTFNCFKIEPVSNDGKPLLKNSGEMKVWISIDNLNLPVKIEQRTNFGTILMKLNKITSKI